MTVSLPRPKYISFDIYGTLINYQMRATVQPMLSDRLTGDAFERFFSRFRLNRYDEVMEYHPYDEILERSYRRTCEAFRIEARDSDVAAIQAAVLTWGPHADVPAPLATMAEHFPLVALSNADDRHLATSIPTLGAPFHAVITAEQAGAYKPRLQAFDHMLDVLDATPDDFMHISAHQLYDVIPMLELGFTNNVYLDRGYDQNLTTFEGVRVTSLDEVNRALGIA
ncbi:HAD-IA family hydrolase [Microbacterium sp.]|uniref:HAD-IA family hydrolase n=1 Tax=Microbacterium sp. TaxID=51671 RepID=UPI0039E588B2